MHDFLWINSSYFIHITVKKPSINNYLHTFLGRDYGWYAVLLQKSTTPKQLPPFYYELTGDGNKKSASKMRHFLNMQTSLRSKSK